MLILILVLLYHLPFAEMNLFWKLLALKANLSLLLIIVLFPGG